MSDDLLGFERFGQHNVWRCRGHVDGGDNVEDVDLNPRTFVFERHLNEWLLTSDSRLLTVGNSQRDLVAAAGGLVRHPAGRGFAGFIGAELLRQTGMFNRQAVSGATVIESTPSQRAGREAVDLRLEVNGANMVLGIDAQTGVWTYFSSPDLDITVVQLEVQPEAPDPSFGLLHLVPEMDLSPHEQVSPVLEDVLNAVQAASGLGVGVLSQDDEAGAFRFVLLDTHNRPVGLVSRVRTTQRLEPDLFGGLWACDSDDDWTYFVNTEGPATPSNHRWAENIKAAIRL